MPKKTITKEFKNAFAGYLNDSAKHYHVCRYEGTSNSDENETNIAVSPLNGSKSVHVNTDTIETKASVNAKDDEIQTSFESQKEDEIQLSFESQKEDEIQLSFESQKEDENIIGFDAGNQNHQQNSDHFISTQELLNVLEPSYENVASCQQLSAVNVPENDELSQIIRFIERQGETTNSEQKQIKEIVGEIADQVIEAIVKENSQKVNDICIYDSSYDLRPDPSNPYLFHIHLKTSNSPANIKPSSVNVTGSQSIFFQW